MDPQSTWDQLLAAYVEGDWDTVQQRASDLIAWLDRGGFPPSILNHADLDHDWNRALARAGCMHALGVLQERWFIQR